ncbi:MAG: hypothetical protein JWO03_3360 [Bacteroidetes bacterium]|nr:hypothetical protein [Bacteroidota bacterium]
MTIKYDQEVDALYIKLLEGEFQCRTLRLGDNVALNIGPNEELVGIEILDARKSNILEKGIPEFIKNLGAGENSWAMAA